MNKQQQNNYTTSSNGMNNNRQKTVCFFGIYDSEYARNRILMKGFRENGYGVIKCRVDPSRAGRLSKYWKLYREYRRIKRHEFTHIIVAYPGHPVVWLARFLFGRRIIFDAFLSLYDSNVFDRKVARPGSIRGMWFWFLDWSACRLAQRVLLDTNQHIDYFVRTFHISRRKFIRVFIGADTERFYPQSEYPTESEDPLTVHFHGNFIPLQGIPYIIDAAHELADEPFRFIVVGSGGGLYKQTRRRIAEESLGNVELAGRMPVEEIPEYIAQADICLGIFGDTPKARRVIPNKVYECVAMQKPVVTGETPAIREAFTDKEDMLFCELSSGHAIADALRRLRRDAALRQHIARGGYQTFNKNLQPQKLVAELLQEL